MAHMDEQTLLSVIEAEESAIDNSDLEADRERALDYYYGRAVGKLAPPAIPNRSEYVSRDVADTIDWIMPALMKTFLAGDEVVKFSPRNAEDVPAAEQETDYINHVILDQNPAYEVFSTWFDDALIQKNGYVYAYWKREDDVQEESYAGLMLDQVTMLTADDEVEIVEVEEIAELDAMGQPSATYNVKLKRTNKSGRLCIENVPPELVKVSARYRGVCLSKAPFCGFDAYLTISQLREDGFDVADDISDVALDDDDAEDAFYRRERFGFNTQRYEQESDDPASRVVRVRHRWMRVDYDGDGIAELRYVMLIGQELLVNEPADIIPMASLTPRIVAHSHVGRSVEEVVADLQELKTQFIRGLIDNTILANNGRYAVDVNLVNLDDMMAGRPGGIVRTQGSPAGAIFPLQHSMLGQPVMAALEMVDSIRETRTGVTKYNMGTDAGTLNKTATGVSIIQSAANQRIEWIARTFAETGVKDLFGIAHALVRKYQDAPAVVRLRNQWVTVDPREWVKRKDMSISVGLGAINREQQSAGIMNLGMLQRQAFQAGIVSPENVFNMATEYAKALGFKDPEQFFTHPEKMPKRDPAPDPRMEKIKADFISDEKDRELEREKFGLEKEREAFDRATQVGALAGEAAAGVMGGMDEMMGGMGGAF